MTNFFKIKRTKISRILSKERKEGYPLEYEFIRKNDILNYVMLYDEKSTAYYFIDKNNVCRLQIQYHQKDKENLKQEYILTFIDEDERNDFLEDLLKFAPASIDTRSMNMHEIQDITVIEYV